MFLVTLDKFDPNLMLVNVNKLKPYQFLDEEAQITNQLELVYWEGQKDIEMDSKDDNHQDGSIFVVQMVPIDGKSMQQMTKLFVEANLDEHCSNPMIGGNMVKTRQSIQKKQMFPL